MADTRRNSSAVDLYERHGAAAYSLARLLAADDEDGAVVLAARAIVDASESRALTADRHRLARHLYVLATRSASTRGRAGSAAQRTLTPGQECALGLALFGQHDYREVADLMDISPETSAELMRSGLRALARHRGG